MTGTVPVSVVIPCYRCAATLERAVASVAGQTRRPEEVILVDDASCDDTAALFDSIAVQYPDSWIKFELLEKNVGVGNARNRGWALASQPFIAFLDADDAWHPCKLEVQYAFMQANVGVTLSGHGHRVLDDTALPDWHIEVGVAKPIQKWAMILSNRFVTPSVMLRRDVKQRFEVDQRYMEDHMLWMKLIADGALTVKLSIDLVALYKPPFGAGGLSGEMWRMEQGELANYRRLFFSGRASAWQFAGLYLFSLTKFARRLLLIALRWRRSA
jgi:glycosyltransferase involved in cell wall biosynthesis